VPDPDGGTVRRVRRGGYHSRTAASRALATVRDPYTEPGRAALTVGGWLREWIETRQGLAPSTLKSYREHIELHLVPGLGLIPLTELGVYDLVAFYRTLAKRRRNGDRAALSAATIQRVNSTLRTALNAARRQGLITRNPASEIALPEAVARGQWCGPTTWSPSGGAPGLVHRSPCDRRADRPVPRLQPRAPALRRISSDRAARAAPHFI